MGERQPYHSSAAAAALLPRVARLGDGFVYGVDHVWGED